MEGDDDEVAPRAETEAETVEERRKRTRRERVKRKRLEQLALVEQLHEKGQYLGLELKACQMARVRES